MIRDVQDLDVYNRSLRLLKPLGDLVNILPKTERDLRQQILSAGHSVPANITEGFAKRQSEKECKRIWRIALGSSDEIITHLRAVQVRTFTEMINTAADPLIADYKIVSKQINALIKRWKSTR